MRTQISEHRAEALCDHAVMERLRRDPAYQNAEDSDARSTREDAIEAEEWAKIERKYLIV